MQVQGVSIVSYLCIELLERRAEVVDKLEEFEGVIDPILVILSHPEVSKHLESFK